MKNNKLTLALATAGMFCFQSMAATIYEHDDFSGKSKTLSPSSSSFQNNFANYGLGGRVSSISVERGECVLLANELNFGGDYLILSGNNPFEGPNYQLSDFNFDNVATGWMVYRAFNGRSCEDSVAYFYQHGGGGGWRYPAPYGIKNSDIWTFNDHASSVTVPAGTCLVAHRNGGFSGGRQSFVGPVTNAPFASDINDTMSSYQLVRQNDVNCFDSYEF